VYVVCTDWAYFSVTSRPHLHRFLTDCCVTRGDTKRYRGTTRGDCDLHTKNTAAACGLGLSSLAKAAFIVVVV